MCCPNNPTEAANCETVLIPYLGMLDKIIFITIKNRTVASFDIFTFSSEVLIFYSVTFEVIFALSR